MLCPSQRRQQAIKAVSFWRACCTHWIGTLFPNVPDLAVKGLSVSACGTHRIFGLTFFPHLSDSTRYDAFFILAAMLVGGGLNLPCARTRLLNIHAVLDSAFAHEFQWHRFLPILHRYAAPPSAARTPSSER